MLSGNAIEGKCKQMCPESEIKMRQEQKLLHPMEIQNETRGYRKPLADRRKIVKEFCRSSAGQIMQKPEVLRPYPVLFETVSYLLNEVLQNEEFPYHVRYDFIVDRLRAVRQDIIIQDIPKPQAICLFQPIVRFFGYASYKMANNRKFDAHLNNKHFQECMKRLLAMYDECEEHANRLNLLNYENIYADSRPQIEAIYLLFNLGDDEALRRGLSLSSRWKHTPEVNSALKISLLYRKKNYISVCQQIFKLPHLLLTVAILHLPAIRKLCLEMMVCAYNSKNLQFPLEKLQELLLYSEVGDLTDDLLACGIAYNLNWDGANLIGSSDKKSCGGVVFIKGQFNVRAKLILPLTKFVEDRLQGLCIEEIVLMGI